MKRILLIIIGIIVAGSAFSQVVSESTIRKFNIGIGVHTDIWMDLPDQMDARTINQGASVFGMYNYRVKESSIYLAAGIGITTHNLYSNSVIEDVKADSITILEIKDNVNYDKSKINLAYIDVPLEFRIKTKKQFRMAFGFRFGYMVNAHTKYKGSRITSIDADGNMTTDDVTVKTKSKDIQQIETWRYGPTFRIGYKWFNVTAYYQLSKVFKVDKGPELFPFSLGIAVIPF